MAVGLGSNLGSRAEHLEAGARALRGLIPGAVFSRVYETRPVGLTDQPRFLNACCVGRTDLAPGELLKRLKAEERARGRLPGPRNAPRELDLDILLYGDEVVETAHLTVPHPRLTERAFALIPLSEIAGDWVHPVTSQTIRELARRVDGAGVEATNLQLGGGGSD